MTDEIKGFFGDFRWLSNFWLCTVVYEGMTFPSTEAAYQAAKTLDLKLREQFQGSGESMMLSGRRAKHLGRKITLRPDWEDVKYDVMLAVTRDKYSRNLGLKELLLLTGDAYLEETNTWNDTCWGVCNGLGENNLGKILMRVREEFRS